MISFPKDYKHLPGLEGGSGRGSCAVRRVQGLGRLGGRSQGLAAAACVGMPSSVPGRDTAHGLAGSQHRQESSQNSVDTGIRLGAGTPLPGTAHPAASTAADPKGGQLAQARSYRNSKVQGGARAGSGVSRAARA